MLSTEAFLRISREVGAPVSRVEAVVALLEGGAGVPFIARYRKEATGGLDEARIQEIDERRAHYTALDQRREAILQALEKQGRLAEEVKQKILLCFNKQELEDLYLPFRSKRKTRSAAAFELGLGPLADYIWEQTGTEPVEVYAAAFVSPPEAELPAPSSAEPAGFETRPETPAGDAAASVEANAEGPAAESAAVQAEAVSSADDSALATPEASAEHAVAVAEAASSLAENRGFVSEAGMEVVKPAGVQSPAPEAIAEMPPVAAAEPAGVQSPAPEAIAETPPVAAAGPAAAAAAEGSSPAEAPAAPVAAQTRPGRSPRRVQDVVQAIEGALHILAERVAENAEFRKQLRDKLIKTGVVRARVAEGKESEKTKYEMYYKFEETVPKIPSHRILAIRRGSRENILTYSIETDGEAFVQTLLKQVIRDAESPFAPYLMRAVRDGYARLLAPAIQNDVRSMLRERAEAEAIRVFEENLRTLLLSPPAGPIAVMGVDPGVKTGCRIAVVDGAGKLADNQTIHLSEPNKDLEGAEKVLVDLIRKHNVGAITLSNSGASREAEAFIRAVVQKNELSPFVVVSDAAGSLYAASKRAREEFPELDVVARGAVSIARRLQDPLSELVKIDPRSIGVGQYQHDVDQKKLKQCLETAVRSCVNRVGVDLNAASEDLLKYVSGLDDALAAAIVSYRTRSGPFRSRAQLMEVDGFRERVFEQSAGFLRVKDGDNPLDRTAVHPEFYPLVERIAAGANLPVADLAGNAEAVNAIDFKPLEQEAGRFTLADIREELLRPGRDPRGKFVAPRFRDDVKEVVDLKEGMELEGRVTNVTNFGAFVDLGVGQDGLVHISELSHSYIQDAREVAKVGEVVKVKVIGLDSATKRISLSMKALQPKPVRPPRQKRPAPAKAGVAAPGRPAPQAQAPGAPPARSPRPPRPAAARTGPPRPPRPPQSGKPGRPQVEITRPAAAQPQPAQTPVTVSAQTMEEKIRLLQQKFGRVG
jgi:uncharacterized protein